MKSLARRMMLIGLALAIALPFAAAQEKERKKKGGGGALAALKQRLAKAELNDEQQKKVNAIIEEHAPKIRAAIKKGGEAKKLVETEKKRLREEGKKGKELNEGALTAAKLTDEQKAGYEELQQAERALNDAVAAVLTDEQKEKAGLAKKKRKNK